MLRGQKTGNVVGTAGTPQLAPSHGTLDLTVLGAFFLFNPKELPMSFTHTVTAGFMPRDIRQNRNTYLPKPKQRPYLETPYANHS